MLFFVLLRGTFLIYNQAFIDIENIPFKEVLKSFWHALDVDLATACYILMLPAVLLFFQGLSGKKWPAVVNRVYTGLMISLYSLVTAAELGLYPEWKTKMSAKALLYLRRPDEAMNSISGFHFFSLLAMSVFIFFIGFTVYKKYFFNRQAIRKTGIKRSLIFIVTALALLFVGLRGGISPIPISPSAAYFSQHNILNLAAVNSGFNLAISMVENQKFNYKNPFEFYSKQEAVKTLQMINTYPTDTTVSILNNADTIKPNIVIVLLESWSADLVESLGGEPGITPEFAKLEKDGVLFTQHYGSGGRSQQAIATLISGFPATPFTTVTENADKYSNLPSLSKILNNQDYHTSFYFGGQLTYGNIKAFLFYNEFDAIIEQEDLEDTYPSGRLGIHDEYLFGHHLDELSAIPQPFFSMVFTLSSHSPYDQPMEEVLDWGGNEKKFINSAYYTDYHLGRYFEEARKKEWYSNTLFIIVADHSHNTYRNWPLESFEYHKIPLLFYGDVLKQEYRGKTIDRIVNNAFIYQTLLNQLGIAESEDTRQPWSNDMFNPACPQYAYFEMHMGYGWKEINGEYVYVWDWDKYPQKNFSPGLNNIQKEQVIKNGRSYLQVLFQEFIDL